jgi:hypothetical protein
MGSGVRSMDRLYVILRLVGHSGGSGESVWELGVAEGVQSGPIT